MSNGERLGRHRAWLGIIPFDRNLQSLRISLCALMFGCLCSVPWDLLNMRRNSYAWSFLVMQTRQSWHRVEVLHLSSESLLKLTSLCAKYIPNQGRVRISPSRPSRCHRHHCQGSSQLSTGPVFHRVMSLKIAGTAVNLLAGSSVSIVFPCASCASSSSVLSWPGHRRPWLEKVRRCHVVLSSSGETSRPRALQLHVFPFIALAHAGAAIHGSIAAFILRPRS